MGTDQIEAEPDGCIVIDPGRILNNAGYVKSLICSANKFTDNLCLPIVEKDRGQRGKIRLIVPTRVDLQGNVLVGYNAAKVRGQEDIDDANQLYFK